MESPPHSPMTSPPPPTDQADRLAVAGGRAPRDARGPGTGEPERPAGRLPRSSPPPPVGPAREGLVPVARVLPPAAGATAPDAATRAAVPEEPRTRRDRPHVPLQPALPELQPLHRAGAGGPRPALRAGRGVRRGLHPARRAVAADPAVRRRAHGPSGLPPHRRTPAGLPRPGQPVQHRGGRRTGTARG